MKKCGMRLRRLLGYYKGTSPGETSSSFLVLLLKYVRTYGRRGNTIPQVRLGTLRTVFQWLGPDTPGPRWELGTLHHHSYQVHTHVIPGIYQVAHTSFVRFLCSCVSNVCRVYIFFGPLACCEDMYHRYELALISK